MAFNFPLEAVLSFRRTIERREWLALQQIATHLNAAKAEVQRLSDFQLAGRQALSREMAFGLYASELHVVQSCEATNEFRKEQLTIQIAGLQRALEEQQRTFQSARRQREALEKMRDQAFRVWSLNMRRSEQKALDELYLLRKRG